MSTVPDCRTVVVAAKRGDRSRRRAVAFQKALDDEKAGRGPGPSAVECLLFTGHTGVSTDGGTTVSEFNPDGDPLATWEVMDRLRNGDAFSGVVRDDTAVFVAARQQGLAVQSIEVILPEPRFRAFEQALDVERKTSQHCYGFPYGDGDCNCTTWLERLGLPLLTGRMDEFIGLLGLVARPRRRFGECV